MPWKLFLIAVCIALVTAFTGYNLENKCAISLGFMQLQNVPIFISLAAAFAAGIMFSILYLIAGKKKPRVQDKKKIKAAAKEEATAEEAPNKKQRPFFFKQKKEPRPQENNAAKTPEKKQRHSFFKRKKTITPADDAAKTAEP